jgi:glutamate racemase
MNNTHPLGIIDSGSGGLSIWQSIHKECPKEAVVYVGDHRYLPYGSKTTTFIVSRILHIIAYLRIHHSCKLIIIACNSATVAGIETYRKKFPEIPIIGVVPVIKTAADVTKTGAIAVLATPFTTRSAYQRSLIARFAGGKKVYAIGCPKLVSLIEKGVIQGPEIQKVLRRELKNIRSSNVDAIALGCTHYPFIQEEMSNVLGPCVQLLDSGGAVARQTIRIMNATGIASVKKPKQDRFITTGDEQNISKIATILTRSPIVFTHVTIS